MPSQLVKLSQMVCPIGQSMNAPYKATAGNSKYPARPPHGPVPARGTRVPVPVDDGAHYLLPDRAWSSASCKLLANDSGLCWPLRTSCAPEFQASVTSGLLA